MRILLVSLMQNIDELDITKVILLTVIIWEVPFKKKHNCRKYGYKICGFSLLFFLTGVNLLSLYFERFPDCLSIEIQIDQGAWGPVHSRLSGMHPDQKNTLNSKQWRLHWLLPNKNYCNPRAKTCYKNNYRKSMSCVMYVSSLLFLMLRELSHGTFVLE